MKTTEADEHTILAIDPGTTESAYVIWDGVSIISFDILENQELLDKLQHWVGAPFPLVIEQVRSYGMPVGATVFDTVFWSGRFYQAWKFRAYQMPRLDVKQHICHDSRAKDSNIRQALIDRFEPGLKPRQRPKGMLKGISNDCWAALGLAATWWDQNYGQ